MRCVNLLSKKAAILGMMTFVVAVVVPSNVEANPQKAANLLDEIEANVLDVREHAARLKSNVRIPESTSWETHYFEVSQMKQRMNRIADLLAKFRTIRDEALPGQNEAFNQIVPEATKVSDLVEKSIQFLENNRTSFAVPAFTKYREYADEIYDRADLMSEAIDMAETRWEIRRLQKES